MQKIAEYLIRLKTSQILSKILKLLNISVKILKINLSVTHSYNLKLSLGFKTILR